VSSEGVASSTADVSYVLPLRWTHGGDVEELASYLREIAAEVGEVIVVDGSPGEAFKRHGQALGRLGKHLPPDPEYSFAMGKVEGVMTGLRAASLPLVVIADDDVRYDLEGLRRMARLLGEADLVRPQNYFNPLPWHARWDTARSLLNRVFTGDPEFPVGDFPGTLGVRRQSLLSAGGYDGDALFENLELMRTIRAHGGSVASPLDLYVARRPPDTAHFLSQRVRQAYDDFAIPGRIGFFLALGPLGLFAAARRPRLLAAAALAVVLAAETGRRRDGGRERFPVSSALSAPAWLTERAVCAWLALGSRLRGGARYGDARIALAANSTRTLRRRSARSRP